MEDIQELLKWGSDNVVLQRQQQLQFEIRKAKRPDYYGILDLTQGSVASQFEIKAAYKVKASTRRRAGRSGRLTK